MTDCGKNRVVCIAMLVMEVMAPHAMLGFQMAADGVDGRAAAHSRPRAASPNHTNCA